MNWWCGESLSEMWPIIIVIITSSLVYMWASAEQLVLISDDVYQMATIVGATTSARSSSPSLTYLIRNHRLLTISDELDRRFNKCIYGNNQESANLKSVQLVDTLLRNECFLPSSKVFANRLNATISIDRMNDLCRSLKIALVGGSPPPTTSSSNSRQQQRIRLSSILIVSSARIISLFRLFCFDLQVPISAIDVLKMDSIFQDNDILSTYNYQVCDLYIHSNDAFVHNRNIITFFNISIKC